MKYNEEKENAVNYRLHEVRLHSGRMDFIDLLTHSPREVQLALFF